jgi:hypothetical protein
MTLNKKHIVVLLAAFVCALSSASEYRAGWNAQNFYQTVSQCKEAIVLPAAADYVKRGRSKNHPEESLRSEAITMVPTFESMASASCYCAISEFAKDNDFGGQVSSQFESYIRTPRCQAQMVSAMEAFKRDPKALKLR